jgi:ATP-dependent helicase HrpA
MLQRQREALTTRSPLPALTDLTGWPEGGVPRTVEVGHAGVVVTGYPALVDEGGTVARRVLPSPLEQRTAMWGGTRRLLLLQLGRPLRTLDRVLPNATKLALSSSRRATAADAYRGCAEVAVDQLLLDAGGPAWDAAGFDQLLDRVRSGFADVSVQAATLVGEVLASAAAVDERLATMHHESLDDTAVDVEAHLGRLLHPGWIAAAGLDRLPDVARYLRAEDHRVAKAAGDPARDRARIPLVQDLEQEYRSLAPLDVDGSIRWQLEELRVATFAQSIGAKGGPSEPKLRAALARLVR